MFAASWVNILLGAEIRISHLGDLWGHEDIESELRLLEDFGVDQRIAPTTGTWPDPRDFGLPEA